MFLKALADRSGGELASAFSAEPSGLRKPARQVADLADEDDAFQQIEWGKLRSRRIGKRSGEA